MMLNSSGSPVIAFPECFFADCSNDHLLRLITCTDADCSGIIDDGITRELSSKDISAVMTSDGRPVISFISSNSLTTLRLAICNNSRCTNRSIIILDSNSLYNSLSLAVDKDDKPIISYYDETNSILKLAACNNLTCTSHSIETVDDQGDVGAHNSLALNGEGLPVISYHDISNGSLKLASCTDRACTVPLRKTIDNLADVVGIGTSLQLFRGSVPIISYSDKTNSAMKMAVCNDESCSDPVLAVVDNELVDEASPPFGVSGVLALGASGVPIVSYSNSIDGVKLAVCPMCKAPERTTVDNSGDVGRYSSLELNQDGFPVISYHDQSISGVKLATCDDVFCKNPTIETIDSSGITGQYTSLAMFRNNASELPLISYYDMSNKDLRYAICADSSCRAALDGADEVGEYNSIALAGVEQAPVISYYDSSNGSLKLVVCQIAFCIAPTIRTIDNSSTSVGKYSSLVISAEGLPRISYYDATKGALKLAICHDTTCASKTLQTVDDGGFFITAGLYSSIALNSQGYPVISYYVSASLMKVAVCNNTTCDQPTLRVVDNSSDVGKYSSIALTKDDFPVISYFDETIINGARNNDLKMAVCGDISCTNPTLLRMDQLGDVGEHTFPNIV